MSSRKFLRLCFWIPLLLLILATTGAGLNLFYRLHEAHMDVNDHARLTLASTMTQLQNDLNDDLSKGDIASANNTLAVTALNPNITTLILSDQQHRALLANHNIWRGKLAASVSAFDPLLAYLAENNQRSLIKADGNNHLMAYYPVKLEPLAGTLRNNQNGTLYIEFDLNLMYDKASHRVVESGLRYWLVSLGLALLLAVILSLTITRRLGRLAETANSLALGDLSRRCNVVGMDEVTLLANALNQMAEAIQTQQQSLQASEAHFRFVTETAQALIWMADTDKLCNWFNKVWLDFTGRTFAQEFGNGWADGVHPDDLQRCFDIYVSHFDRREPFSMEYRLRRFDGEYRWLLDNGAPRYDGKGEFLGYIGSCFDITDRKDTEKQLLRMSKLYKALSETNQAIVRMKDPEALFPLVCRFAIDFGGLTMAWIGKIDEKGPILPVATYGSGTDYLIGLNLSIFDYLPEGRGPNGTAARENRPVIINDYLADPMTALWHAKAKQYGWGSAATFPIHLDNAPHAIFTVYSNEIGFFDPEQIALLNEMAGDIGYALDNFAREHHRRLLVTQLEESQKRLSHIIEVSPALIYSLKPDTHNPKDFILDFVSPTVQSITGYSIDEWRSNPSFWYEHLHPEDRASASKAQLELFETGILRHQYRFLHADGNYRWTDDQLILNRDAEGQPLEIVGSWLDITETRQAEAKAVASEQRFRAYFERSMVGMATTSPEKGWLDVNDALCEMLGYQREQLANMTWSELTHPNDLSADLEQFNRLLSGEIEEYTLDKRFIRGNGEIIDTCLAVRGVRKPDGKIDYLVTLVEDITERTKALKAASLSTDRVRGLLKMTQQAPTLSEQALVEMALEQAETLTNSQIAYAHFVNQDQETISFGSGSKNTLKSCDALQNNHYPISSAGVWADCLRQRQPVIHNIYPELEINNDIPAGHASFTRHIGVPVIENDFMVMIMGVGNKPFDYDTSDLNELSLIATSLWALLHHKRDQLRLELDAEVFRYSQEGVLITDANNNIISANQAFTDITGYSREEVLGKNPRLLKSGSQDDSVYEAMWSKLLKNNSWQGEIWNRRKNGEIYPQWLSLSLVRDSENQVSHHIGLMADISAHKAAEEKIHTLAHYDPLTHLPNRTLLQDRIKVAISAAERSGNSVAFMFLDLDRFKNVNDSLGHPIGDLLLQKIAQLLTALLREQDTVSRLGGDEFNIVLPNSDAAGAAHVADKILLAIATPIQVDHYELRLSISLGIAMYPENGRDYETLSRSADTALYRAKALGRNNFQFFTDEMHVKARELLDIENALRLALKRDEFLLYYQPQVDAITGRITGMEALIRWQHPEWGLVPPGKFIQVAEETGLILEIGDWVMHCAVKQILAWRAAGIHLVPVAVNVSIAQFRQPNMVEKVTRLIAETGLPPALLELELTESIAMDDLAYTIETLDKLHNLGIELSIDDFGTGYSSLSYLKRFKVQKLKIDQSFVRDLGSDPDDEAVVIAIISLAQSLGFTTIAEGVETTEQLAFLRARQCCQIQGYLFSRPLPAQEMTALLTKEILHPTGV